MARRTIGELERLQELLAKRAELNKANPALGITLEIAVPMWIDTVRHYSPQERQTCARICSDYVAAHGDNLLYRSKKPGETAKVFNKLAEGVALAATVPGGVTILGRHWEYSNRHG